MKCTILSHEKYKVFFLLGLNYDKVAQQSDSTLFLLNQRVTNNLWVPIVNKTNGLPQLSFLCKFEQVRYISNWLVLTCEDAYIFQHGSYTKILLLCRKYQVQCCKSSRSRVFISIALIEKTFFFKKGPSYEGKKVANAFMPFT